MRVGHHSTTVEEHDEAVLAIEQVIDLFLNAVNVTAEHLARVMVGAPQSMGASVPTRRSRAWIVAQ